MSTNEKAGCSMAGCDRPARAKGVCWPHYQRQRRQSKNPYPIRPYESDDIEIAPMRVQPLTYAKIALETDSREGWSDYMIVREILESWYAVYKSAREWRVRFDQPGLEELETLAKEGRRPHRRNLVRVTSVRVSKPVFAALN